MLTHVESSRTMATGLSSGRILVVDDDPAVRHLISDYFGEHGIQTVSATGRSAAASQLAPFRRHRTVAKGRHVPRTRHHNPQEF
jgi:hypothetical protein